MNQLNDPSFRPNSIVSNDNSSSLSEISAKPPFEDKQKVINNKINDIVAKKQLLSNHTQQQAKSLKNQLDSQTSAHNFNQIALDQMTKSFSGLIVKLTANSQKISNFLSKFDLFRGKYHIYSELKNQLKSSSLQIDLLQKKIQQVNQQFTLEEKELDLQKSSLEMQKKIDERMNQTWNVIYDLFGGQKEFEKLPILDLKPIESRQRGPNEYIDYIWANDFPPNSSIVRGEDGQGRAFFAVKNNADVQVFFQRFSKNTKWEDDDTKYEFNHAWAYAGDNIMNTGQVTMQDLLSPTADTKKLKESIQNLMKK